MGSMPLPRPTEAVALAMPVDELGRGRLLSALSRTDADADVGGRRGVKQAASNRELIRLTAAALLRVSGSGLPVGPAQFVEQKRREDADEEGRGEQRQEVRQWAYVSKLARREQTDHAGGRGGERPHDADR